LNSLIDIQTAAAIQHVNYAYGFWIKQQGICRIMPLVVKRGPLRTIRENNTPINGSIFIHVGLKVMFSEKCCKTDCTALPNFTSYTTYTT
jgi:hypothetical protein